MGRRWKVVLVMSLAAALLWFGLTQTYSFFESRSTYSLPLAGQVVFIDPGHGGRDGGASSRSGVLEKDVTLSIGLYLRDLLEQSGAFVHMTRETDMELASEEAHRQKRRKKEDMSNRIKMINDSDADVMISIHLNSIAVQNVRGAQTFYDPQHEENKVLAELVQEEITRNLENTNRHAKAHSDLFILRYSEVPGVLVEAGFLSNPGEAGLLADEQYQKKLAFSMYIGILRYLGEITPENEIYGEDILETLDR